MSLHKFLNYRNNCPFCDDKLQFIFHSKKRQVCVEDGDDIKIVFDLKSIKRGQKNYKIEFIINKYTNSFYIEFYNKNMTPFDNQVPLFLLKRFREFNANHGAFRFYKYCDGCGKYNFQSQYFELDYVTQTFEETIVSTEAFSFVQIEGKQRKIISMSNFYQDNKTWIRCGRSSLEDKEDLIDFVAPITISLIPFISKEETLNRLNTLLLFS